MRSKSLRMKNGFTVIELILSFAFVSALAASLFAAVVNYRDKEEEATIEARLITFKNRMTLEIQKDIETRMLNNVEYCRDVGGNIINRCVVFNFLDGTSKILQTDFETQHDDYGSDSFEYLVPFLVYGDLRYDIPDAIDIDVENDYMLKYTTYEDALENNTGLYNVDLAFSHMKYDIKFDINIIATGITPFEPNAIEYPEYHFGEKVLVQVNSTDQLEFFVLQDSDKNNSRVVLIKHFVPGDAFGVPRLYFNNDENDGNQYMNSTIRNYLENDVYNSWTALENKSDIRLATFEEMAYINAICPDIRDRVDDNHTIYLTGDYQDVMEGDFWLMSDYYVPGQNNRVYVVYTPNGTSGEQLFDKVGVHDDYNAAAGQNGYGVKPVITIKKEYILSKLS